MWIADYEKRASHARSNPHSANAYTPGPRPGCTEIKSPQSRNRDVCCAPPPGVLQCRGERGSLPVFRLHYRGQPKGRAPPSKRHREYFSGVVREASGLSGRASPFLSPAPDNSSGGFYEGTALRQSQPTRARLLPLRGLARSRRLGPTEGRRPPLLRSSEEVWPSSSVVWGRPRARS